MIRYIEEKILLNSLKIRKEELPFPIHSKTFDKNQIITQFDEKEIAFYLLKEGVIEKSIIENKELKITGFVFPEKIFCAYDSFISGLPSNEQIISLSKVTVEYIYRSALVDNYDNSIIANRIGLHLAEEAYIEKLQREYGFLTKTAKEVYIEMLTKQPEIVEKIPINKIAKYLGIHPESLSRIRMEIFPNKGQ